jgi:hypothetical protein
VGERKCEDRYNTIRQKPGGGRRDRGRRRNGRRIKQRPAAGGDSPPAPRSQRQGTRRQPRSLRSPTGAETRLRQAGTAAAAEQLTRGPSGAHRSGRRRLHRRLRLHRRRPLKEAPPPSQVRPRRHAGIAAAGQWGARLTARTAATGRRPEAAAKRERQTVGWRRQSEAAGDGQRVARAPAAAVLSSHSLTPDCLSPPFTAYHNILVNIIRNRTSLSICSITSIPAQSRRTCSDAIIPYFLSFCVVIT